MNFFREAATILATSIATIPLSLAANVIVTRNLTADGRGQFAVVSVLAGTLVMFANMGWPQATIYRLKRMRSDPAEVVTAGLLGSVTLALLFVALGAGLAALGFGDFGAVPASALWLGLATVPFQLIQRLFSFAARGIDRFDIRNWSVFATAGLRPVFLGGAWLLFPGDLPASLWANLIAVGIVAVVTAGAVLKQTGLVRRVNPEEIRESLKFGMATTAQNLAGELHQQVDILLMGPLGTPAAEIGVYAIAVGLIQQLRHVPDSIGMALFPRLTQRDEDKAADFTVRVSRHSTLWVLATSLGMGVVAPLLVPILYGRRYLDALPAFYILLPAMAALMTFRVMARYFISRGRQQLNIVTQLAALVLNVGLNLYAIPHWGIAGAAFASVVSYAFEAVVVSVAFFRETGRGAREAFVFRWSEDWPVYQRRIDVVLKRLRLS